MEEPNRNLLEKKNDVSTPLYSYLLIYEIIVQLLSTLCIKIKRSVSVWASTPCNWKTIKFYYINIINYSIVSIWTVSYKICEMN